MVNYNSLKTKMGERLIECRVRYGLTQREVANALDCSIRSYSTYEEGKVFMSLLFLKRLSEHYKISADYILGLSNSRRIYIFDEDTRFSSIDHIGEYFEYLRRKRGYSIRYVIDHECSTFPNYLNYYYMERNGVLPYTKHIIGLAKIYGINVDTVVHCYEDRKARSSTEVIYTKAPTVDGQRIKDLQASRRYSMDELMHGLRYDTAQSVHNFFNKICDRNLPLERYYRFAVLFDVSLDYIFGFKSDPEVCGVRKENTDYDRIGIIDFMFDTVYEHNEKVRLVFRELGSTDVMLYNARASKRVPPVYVVTAFALRYNLSLDYITGRTEYCTIK